MNIRYIIVAMVMLLFTTVVSAEIFTIAPSYESITYPDFNNITITFKNPDFLWKDQTYIETKLSLTIEGKGEFSDGTQSLTKDYGSIDEATSDSFMVKVMQDASCKEGDSIEITAIVSYKLDDGDTVTKEPIEEELTTTFIGRYCETAVCEVKLAQSTAEKNSYKDAMDEKEVELVRLQSELSQVKEMYAQCNSTQVVCEECKGIALKSLTIPAVVVLVIILGMYIYIQVLKKTG